MEAKMGQLTNDRHEKAFARALQMISFGVSVDEIRAALLTSGLDEGEAYLCYTAARLLAASEDVKPRNQCDGCCAGIPVDERGNHRMGSPGGYSDLMGCQKDKYR